MHSDNFHAPDCCIKFIPEELVQNGWIQANQFGKGSTES